MTIDNTCESKSINKEKIVEILKTMVFGAQAFERFNAKERETLDKAWNIIDQYENRLKADLVAMFTELQLEIEEKATELCDDGWWLSYNYLIQQKIDKLKENTDGNK